MLAGALAVWAGGRSFTPSMDMSRLESSCRGRVPSSEENGLGGFSRHISQLVFPEHATRGRHTHTGSQGACLSHRGWVC